MVFEILPGNRIKRFRNRQTRCRCGKKRHGRPGVGRGVCHWGTQNKPRRREWKVVPWEESYGSTST
jgi:hypothetical protein